MPKQQSRVVHIPMSSTNPAVVLGLSANGLGIVRSLYAAGVPVIGVDKKPDGMRDSHRWMSSKTHLCRKIFYREDRGETLLKSLRNLGPTLPGKGVLLPSGDNELLCISHHREELAQHYLFRIPEPRVVEFLTNKAKSYPRAEQLGVGVPLTIVDPRLDEINDIATKMRYPCLIKPHMRDNAWNRLFPRNKVFSANDPDNLVRLFHEIYPQYQDFLIQEVIPGPDSDLYFSNVYLAEDLAPLAIWTGRKLRQRPIHFGTSTLTETVWVEEISAGSIALLQKLECIGYANIEFKKDPRDGHYKIMEVTPGRTWYPHYLGFGAGVNIPLVWYKDLLGIPQMAVSPAVEGVRWVDEYRDLFSSYSYWKQGELTLRDWLRSFRGRKVYAYANRRDPLPIVYVVLRLLLAAPLKFGRWLRRLANPALD